MSDNRRAIGHAIVSGHAFNPRRPGNHINEFRDPKLGPVLDVYDVAGNIDKAKMVDFIDGMLSRHDVQVLTDAGPPQVHHIYDPKNNVLMTLNPENSGDFGTIYRPDGGPNKLMILRRQITQKNPRAASPINHGPGFASKAIQRFQKDVAKIPKSLKLLKKRAAEIGEDVVAPSKSVGTPGADPSRASLDSPEQKRVNDILESKNTEGFWADRRGRVMHFYNEAEKAVVTVTSSGEKTAIFFDSAKEAKEYFGEKMDTAWRANKQKPSVHVGNFDGLVKEFKNTKGIWPKIARGTGKTVKFLAKVARILGPLGIAGATAEAAELQDAANQAAEYGIISEDAILAYEALLLSHIAQATADPSLVGGEAAIQAAFEEWGEAYGIPDHIMDSLEPSSLIEMILGDINAKSRGPVRDPRREAMLEMYRRLPSEVSEDMPPGLAEFVRLKIRREHLASPLRELREELDRTLDSDKRMTIEMEIMERRRQLADLDSQIYDHYRAMERENELPHADAWLWQNTPEDNTNEQSLQRSANLTSQYITLDALPRGIEADMDFETRMTVELRENVIIAQSQFMNTALSMPVQFSAATTDIQPTFNELINNQDITELEPLRDAYFDAVDQLDNHIVLSEEIGTWDNVSQYAAKEVLFGALPEDTEALGESADPAYITLVEAKGLILDTEQELINTTGDLTSTEGQANGVAILDQRSNARAHFTELFSSYQSDEELWDSVATEQSLYEQEQGLVAVTGETIALDNTAGGWQPVTGTPQQ